MCSQVFFPGKWGLLKLPVSGNKLQIRGWEMLPKVSQQLITDVCSYMYFQLEYLGVHRRFWHDRGFMFTSVGCCWWDHSIGCRWPVFLSGDPVRYIWSQFLHWNYIGNIHFKFSPRSLDVTLASLVYGDRAKPVKKPRPSEGKIKDPALKLSNLLIIRLGLLFPWACHHRRAWGQIFFSDLRELCASRIRTLPMEASITATFMLPRLRSCSGTLLLRDNTTFHKICVTSWPLLVSNWAISFWSW